MGEGTAPEIDFKPFRQFQFAMERRSVCKGSRGAGAGHGARGGRARFEAMSGTGLAAYELVQFRLRSVSPSGSGSGP